MNNTFQYTPRCVSLIGFIRGLVTPSKWVINAYQQDPSRPWFVSVCLFYLEQSERHSEGTGETLEQALEDLYHNLAVVLDG